MCRWVVGWGDRRSLIFWGSLFLPYNLHWPSQFIFPCPPHNPTQDPKPAHRSIPVGVTAWDQSPKLLVFVLWVEVEVGTQYRGYKKPKRAHK